MTNASFLAGKYMSGEKLLRIGVTTLALVAAIIHIRWPEIKIDDHVRFDRDFERENVYNAGGHIFRSQWQYEGRPEGRPSN